MEATIRCSCGSERWAVEQPVTDASKITCESCGAVSTMGKAKEEAAMAYATKKIKDTLGGIDGFTIH